MYKSTPRRWLRDFRAKKGLTQRQVAENLGLSKISYQSFELGLRTPAPSTAQRIGKFLSFDWTLFYPPINDDTPSSK